MIDYIVPFFFLATGFIANKLILAYISPGLLVGLRMLIAGAILISVALWYGRWTFLSKVQQRWLQLLILSSFAAFIPALLKAYALKHTYSSKVALIGSLDPFLTALYAYILWREPLTLKKWLGILLAVTGTCVLIISHSAENAATILGPISWGELAALGAAAISRYGWIKIQQLLKANIFNVQEINGITMLCAGIYSLASTAIFMPAAFTINWTWGMGLLLAYTVLGGNIVGYQLYSYMLKKHSATFVSLAGFSMPIFVYLLGWLVVGETLYPSFILASLITFGGMLVFYQDELQTQKSL